MYFKVIKTLNFIFFFSITFYSMDYFNIQFVSVMLILEEKKNTRETIGVELIILLNQVLLLFTLLIIKFYCSSLSILNSWLQTFSTFVSKNVNRVMFKYYLYIYLLLILIFNDIWCENKLFMYLANSFLYKSIYK